MGARGGSKSRNFDFILDCHPGMLGEHRTARVCSGGCDFGVRKFRGAQLAAGLIAFSRAKRARFSAANFVAETRDRLVLYMGSME